MQALHRKLDVVLVQILPYNCSETDYSFCEDSPQQYPDAGFTPDPFSPPPLFFSLQFPSISLNPMHLASSASPISHN